MTATLDVLRGTYRFDEAWIVHDVGESIDPAVDLGQVEGAFAQGLGWAALEDLRYDESGKLLSDTLSTYKLPDIRFMPAEIEGRVPLGTPPTPRRSCARRPIGEPPFLYGIAGYFAVLDALARGAGRRSRTARRFYDLPMTPEKALDYLQGGSP